MIKMVNQKVKKLPFKCPICGGRLIKSIFKIGSTDYKVSLNGYVNKKPIRQASRNLDSLDDSVMICCENVFKGQCDFKTNALLEFEESKYRCNYRIRETYGIDKTIYTLEEIETEEDY